MTTATGRPASSWREWGYRVGLALAVALPIALARTTFLAVPTTEGTWRGIADPPGAAQVGLALLLGAAVSALLARAPRIVTRPLLAGALAAAPLWPVLTGFGVFLLVFSPPVMIVVCSAALAVALVRAWGGAAARLPDWTWPAAAFVFYLAVGLHLPGPAGPQGDEPHYLTMAESLLSDRDIDLRDELESRAYAPFYAGTLAPHTSPASPPGRDYPIHTPGLPVLMLPAYALAGYPGARAFQSLIAALAVAVVARLAHDSGARPAVPALLLAVTPPFAFYAVSLYPETPVALAGALLLLASRPGATVQWRVLASVAAGVVPWLHPKYLPMAALGLVLTTWRRSWSERLLSLGGLAASTAGLLFFMHAHYGRAALSAAYGGGFRDDVMPLRALWGAPALLFDREFGLFAIAPLWLLVIPGAAAWVRRQPALGGAALALAATGFLVNASFSMWWGGTCPPARFVIPCLPLLALGVAEAAARRPTLAAALAGAGLGVVAVACDAPRALHNRADGESALLRVLARPLELDRLLPSFASDDGLALVLSASLLGAFALGWRLGGRGALLGLAAYGVLVAGLRPGHLLDRREATLALIDGWDDRAVVSLAGAPEAQTLAVPLALPEAPWDMGPDDTRRSRRLDLAPGRYRLDVQGQILEALPTAHVIRLDLVAADDRLVRLYLEDGQAPPSAVLDLPGGARRVRLEALGIQGRGRIESATLTPLELVPRHARRPGR